MEVEAVEDGSDFGADGADFGFDVERIAVANGVGEDDAVRTCLGKPDSDANDVGDRDDAVEGTAESGGAGGVDHHVARLGAEPGDHAADLGDLVVGGAVGVGPAMAFGDRNRDGNALGTGVVGGHGAAQIGGECDDFEAVSDLRQQHRLADDGVSIGHLRDELGGDEAADLDLRQAGGGEGGDPAMLDVRRHDRLGDL